MLFAMPITPSSTFGKAWMGLLGIWILLNGPTVQAQNFAGDMALSKVLIEGEDWQQVMSGFDSSDGTCTDPDGHFYFVGRKGRQTSIYKLDPNDRADVYIKDAPGVSGLAWGPDRRLYGCRWGRNEVFVFQSDGSMKPLTNALHANDLVISKDGTLFFTSDTGLMQWDVDGQKKVLSTDLASPNGICFSPDMGNLIVSEYQGEHVWAFTVQPGLGVSHGAGYMTLRRPSDGSAARGDGMTVDTAGRFYVTSAIGLQMFDATGRISGVIAHPASKGMNSVSFAGPDRSFLYVTCRHAVYKRKTQATGVRPTFNSARP